MSASELSRWRLEAHTANRRRQSAQNRLLDANSTANPSVEMPPVVTPLQRRRP